MLKKWVVFSFVSIISFDALAAGLRDAKEIFNEPQRGSLTQVLLGLSELGVARAVWPGLAREERALAEAEKQLALTRRLPTSEVERIARIEANATALTAYEEARVLAKNVMPATPNVPTLAEELRFLADAKPVTLDERAALVAKAEERVAEQARLSLVVAQQEGILSKTVRIVRKGSSLLIALDVASRAYVWGVLEASPGLTPVVGYSASQIRSMLE